MKKILKKEVIIAFIIGIILASSIAVYAYSYVASEIKYTKPGTTQEISVETALNELYENRIENISMIYNKTYVGDGVTFSYILDKDYKKVIVQGDCRAADQNIYINIVSPTSFTKDYDSGLGFEMDKSWDRTVVYSAVDLKKDDEIIIKGRYKGTVIIFGVE